MIILAQFYNNKYQDKYYLISGGIVLLAVDAVLWVGDRNEGYWMLFSCLLVDEYFPLSGSRVLIAL